MGVHTTNSRTQSSQSFFPDDPQKTAESKRSLGCPVRPLPWLPKIRISLAISCPMALPKLVV